MALQGYADRVARVDLTRGTITYEGINPEDARKYIGARGLGDKFVFDNGPQVEPLSPDNIVCLVNGPLTGSPANMSGRLAACTKSPLTGTILDSHMGGFSAARLRWAGFDALIFGGKSEKPVYAVAENGHVTLHDASDLWGKGVRETVRILKERHGDKNVSVMAIGQAGENLVRFACIVNEDDRTSGRGGAGAVMGYKKLKAVVAIGSMKDQWKPDENVKEAFNAARKTALKGIMASPLTAPGKGGVSVYGTNVLMNMINELGSLPTRNGQRTYHPDADKVSGEAIREHYLVSEPACHACPVTCKKKVEIKDGPWKGTQVESVEYETAWVFGPNCDMMDPNYMFKLLDQCNDYGMDTIELGNAMSTTMEATEMGLLNDGMNWGDGDRMVEVAEEVAFGTTPLGRTLARGAFWACSSWGHPELANAVKGQCIPAYDPRGIQGIGLNYATSNRGACHVRGYSIAAEVAGTPEPVDRTLVKGKGALVKTFQDLHAFSDSFDLCKFSAFAMGVPEYVALYNAVTGNNITVEDMMKTGERIYNLERYYNNLAGFGEGCDYLPKRFLEQPATDASEGMVSHLPEMLEEYYELRGWVKGVVPEEKLRELEII